MLLLLAAVLLGATGASSGPDLAERAVAVELPIAEVMVFSDRARVTRRGTVKLSGGPQVFRAPDVPGAVMLDSVRVTATGSKVVRVETRPVQRERWSIDQVDGWIVELEKRGDEIAVVEGAVAAARAELALLSGLGAAPPLPEKDRLGTTTSPSPEAWKDAQDQLAKRRVAARVTEHNLELKLRTLRSAYGVAQREVLKRDLGGFSDTRIEVVVIVDGGSGTGALVVEYAVPGAFWKPAYDLAFNPDIGTVELKASGVVTQATGEDWPQVKLALSTAVPGQGIDLPQLRTWTLGDDREYVPYATARSTPRMTQPFLPPAPKPRLAELQREADNELLASRTEELLALASTPVGDGISSGVARGGMMGGAVKGAGLAYSENKAAERPMPVTMAAPSAPMRQEAAYDMDDAVVASESTVRRSGPSAGKDEAPMRMQGLALRAGIGWQRPTFDDALLPAMSAGGLDYVYDAPVRVTVRSQAEGVRVPLAVRKYPVQTFYEATPSLTTTAYLKATVKNGSALPILAGPANVFVKGTFSGDAQLMTTGPAGVLELPLGADEDIRLTRTVVPATKTQGVLFGEQDVTDYVVKIEIGNYKKAAVTLRVIEVLPRTDAEKLKIELVSTSMKPVTSTSGTTPDADGLLAFHVDVPAGKVVPLSFTYRITRPKNWRLSQ